MPTLPTYIVEPIWKHNSSRYCPQQCLGRIITRLPPLRHTADRTDSERLVQVLVFGCYAYERIADEACSATTLRRRRDEWIAHGIMNDLRGIALEACDRFVGLRLADVASIAALRKLFGVARKRGKAR